MNELLKKKRTIEEMMDRPLFVGLKKTNDYEALTSDGIRYIMRKIGKKAHIDKVHPHRF